MLRTKRENPIEVVGAGVAHAQRVGNCSWGLLFPLHPSTPLSMLYPRRYPLKKPSRRARPESIRRKTRGEGLRARHSLYS